LQVSDEELKRYEELQLLALDFAREDCVEELKAMLVAGMPVNLSDHKGNTLLMLASYNGSTKTTQMLVDFGAQVDKKNDRGQTPLAGVCFKGYVDIVKILVKAGTNINENNGMGMTPIMFASMFGNTEIVEYFSNGESDFKTKAYLGISKITSTFKKLKN